MRWESVGNFYYTIYTRPKAAFLTCSHRQNMKLRLRNAAPSQTKAAFLKRGFKTNLKPHFIHAASDQI